MTVSQLWILFFWMLDGMKLPNSGSGLVNLLSLPNRFLFLMLKNVGRKLIEFSKNQAAVIISSIFLLHVIGVFWSEDLQFALKDLRIKLPLLYFPIIFSTIKTVKNKVFQWLFGLYIATLTVSTVIGLIQAQSATGFDGQSLSPFINHIRFSMNILMGIFILGYYTLLKTTDIRLKILFVPIIFWFSIYLFWMESLTGIALLIAGLSFFVLILVKNLESVALRIGIILIFIGLPIYLTSLLVSSVKDLTVAEKIDFENIETHTPRGNKYTHDTLWFTIEEGRYTGLYVCYKELNEQWSKRSDIDFYGKDKKNQHVRYTLIRYMNSKNLRKDQDGFAKLTDQDIENVENGYANVVYTNIYSIKRRIHKVAYGFVRYKKYGNANNNSLFQRIEYWKTSANIIGDNPIFGTGTGDTKIAFERKYNELESSLNNNTRHRSHNQFLAITIAFGITGLIWFLYAFFGGPYLAGAYKKTIFNLFMIIAAGSMFWEDSLETQAGLTFITFLYCLFIFVYQPEDFKRNA